MKKFISVALVLVMCLSMLPFGALADATSGTFGENIKWSFDNGTLTLSGTGDMPNVEKADDIPWCSLKENIQTAVIEKGITTIGDNAFANCENLTSVTIPDGVTSIGIKAFYFCKKLSKPRIPSSVVSIGSRAFVCCKRLETVTFLGERPQGMSGSTFTNDNFGTPAKITISVHRNDTTWTDCEGYWRSGSAYESDYWYDYKIEFHNIHSYVSTVRTAPTCEQEGVTSYSCRCGYGYDEKVPATGHHYQDGKCVDCGKTQSIVNKFGDLFNNFLNTIRDFFRNIFSWLPFVK